jgi:choline dehydrogenase
VTQFKDFGEFDYVIAGGGTAGCVLANRLSADPEVTVLLLEAGSKDDWIWIHIPIGYLKCINNPRTDWCYKTEAEPGLNGRSIVYARGKVLGGCSSINGMLYLRGQVRDYEEWAQITGDSRWNWDSVLPVFKQSEDYWGGADDDARRQGRVARRKAAPALGHPRPLHAGRSSRPAFHSSRTTTAVTISASATSK